MRKALVILFLLLSITVDARVRWVTPRGNDANTGADSSATGAWASWGKAFSTAIAGDTVYIRGGVYYVTSSSQYGNIANDGTDGNYINFWAYPDDWDAANYPILDFGRYVAPDWTYAIRAYHDNYLYFKGLTIRNLVQNPTGGYVQGIEVEECHHIKLENLNVHHIGGPCISSHGSDELYIKNCDTWESCDSLATNPGQNGTGIGIGTRRSYTYVGDPYDFNVYVEGCRAWNCSDQGFAQSGVGHHEWKNCWSFNNGRFVGEGWGMKLTISSESDTINPLSRVIRNCIFAVNASGGIDPNNVGGNPMNGHYYNNFIYRQGYKPGTPYYVNDYIGCGIWIPNYIGSTPGPNEMYVNNISYDNDKDDVVAHDAYTHEYNSWEVATGVTVTDDDFLSLDTLELLLPRQSDWSLPDINFGKLAPGSDLIDAGRDSIVTRDYAIALDYVGDAPDLGWAEYEDVDSTATDILTFTLASQTGAATINTTNHTVAIEVAYTANVAALTPTITMSYGATISPLSGVSQNFTSPVTYTVTALDGTTTQEWTVTVTQEAEPVTPVPTGGAIIKFGGKIVKR